MSKFFVILIFIFVLSLASTGQEKYDTIPKICLATIATVTQGNSYITLPMDIGNR